MGVPHISRGQRPVLMFSQLIMSHVALCLWRALLSERIQTYYVLGVEVKIRNDRNTVYMARVPLQGSTVWFHDWLTISWNQADPEAGVLVEDIEINPSYCHWGVQPWTPLEFQDGLELG